MTATSTFTSDRIEKVQNLLESAGWSLERFQWHPGFSAYNYNWLKAGDTIFQCQMRRLWRAPREFETLIVVIHNDPEDGYGENGLMQYHWSFNGQFLSKGESVDYVKDFLAPFLVDLF